MSAKDLQTEFWRQFATALPSDFTDRFGEMKERLGSAGYRQFSQPLPLGFRLVSVALPVKDELRAELTSDRTSGIEFVERLSKQPNISRTTNGGGVFSADISKGSGGFGRLALFWPGAQLANRSLWSAHHLWLVLAMTDLVDSIVPILPDSAK